jgi:hypothetical protein
MEPIHTEKVSDVDVEEHENHVPPPSGIEEAEPVPHIHARTFILVCVSSPWYLPAIFFQLLTASS